MPARIGVGTREENQRGIILSNQHGVTVLRLSTILERQEPPRFGREYVPSTFATKEEAPTISRPAILQSTLLDRELHSLGQPETHAMMLALHYPWLKDLHDQKMLSRWASPHPMAGLPTVDATRLPPLRGTIEVAARIGYLDLHPFVTVPDPGSPNGKVKVPFPYQGDLLLYLQQHPGGEIYCVNWPIKDTRAGFTVPGPDTRHPESAAAKRKALARFEIEIAYYNDAHIRTQPVANEDIDPALAHNLCQIFPYTTKRISDHAEQRRSEIIGSFKAGIIAGESATNVILSLISRRLCDSYDGRVIFFQAIWERHLRVDLFRPVLVDYPMRPEVTDVFDRYAEWFLP